MASREYPSAGFHPFRIVVKIEGQHRRFTVIQTLKGIGEEHYKVIARNKTLVFSTNKPIIERRELTNFPWTWTLIEGELRNQRALEAITAALEAQLRGKPGPGGGLYAA